MEVIEKLFDTLLHLSPESVSALAKFVGPWLYGILFLIIFCETGLVATPLLPGDSLLFAVGAVAAMPGSPIDLPLMAILLCAAAVLGDTANYAIGYRLGPKVFSRENSRLFNKKHLLEAQHFYENYGGKTIVLARFMPIIRTFAPFVAGIGKMNYFRFAVFNVAGGVAWVLIFLLGGFWLGKQVQHQFTFVILAIIAISLVPVVIEFWRGRWRAVAKASAAEAAVNRPVSAAVGQLGSDLSDQA